MIHGLFSRLVHRNWHEMLCVRQSASNRFGKIVVSHSSTMTSEAYVRLTKEEAERQACASVEDRAGALSKCKVRSCNQADQRGLTQASLGQQSG
jgi:hypothetical protein